MFQRFEYILFNRERIGGAAKKPGTRKSVAAKYRHPATGETWSGRGRPPHWLADEVAKGKKREEFLVG